VNRKVGNWSRTGANSGSTRCRVSIMTSYA
jgi:hypothetical protein